jgi:uncharacterized glyoxalase superfamily protein PhnB
MLTPAASMVSAGLCDKTFQRRNPRGWLERSKLMKFASTRLVAADIKALVGFYELVTGQTAEWLAPVFAEIVTPSATLAIGSAETVALFKEGSAEPAANRTAIIEFQVDDVDAEFARLKDKVEVVHEPTMMPWGNRAAQFRDPEGTLVGMYTPVTDAAKQRFASR